MGKSETFLFGCIVCVLVAAIAGVEAFYQYSSGGTYHSEPNATTHHFVKLLEKDQRWQRGPSPNAIGIYDDLERDWRILIEFDGEHCVRFEQCREDIRREFAAFEMDVVRKAFETRKAVVWGTP